MTTRAPIRLLDILQVLPQNAAKTVPRLKALPILIGAKPDKIHSIGKLLEENAVKFASRPALKFENEVYTYQEFNAWANRLARRLQYHGITRGDSIAVMMDNHPALLALVAACAKIGAIAALLNTNQRGDILKHSLKTVEAKGVVIGAEHAATFEASAVDFAGVVLGYGTDALGNKKENLADSQKWEADQNLPETAEITLGETAFYILTSGTTGLPKASRMSHLRWRKAMAGMGLGTMGLTEQDVVYCCLPLYHNNGLTVAWSAAMGSGGCLALARKFSASRFWDDARKYGATCFIYIGELCRYLINQPAKSDDINHRITKMLGNGLRPELWQVFKQRFGVKEIYEFYGASECNIGFTNLLNLDQTLGMCPYSYAIVECDQENGEVTRDKNGFMRKVKKGGTGLLLAEITDKAPYEGYTDAKASESKVFRDVFKKGDAYFNTGDLLRDLGFRHAQFVDRLGDTFRWKGENVATTEVEQGANGFAQVAESVAYGVQIANMEGRCGMLAVTPTCPASAFDWQGFAAHLRENLPGYAIPRFVRLRDHQETTQTFKYQKNDLRKAGFDPNLVAEPLYFIGTGNTAPQVLDQILFAKIQSHEIGL